jgi:hypothetical protein
MAVAIVALVLAAGGFAVAAIPGKDGSITACFSKRSGALRVVAASKPCRPGERRIVWSQEGPRGPRGVTGPAGSDATIEGVAAGGDLTGSYPDPSIAAGAIGSSEVLDNSLTGNDVNESALGQVPNAGALDGIDSTGFLQGQGTVAPLNFSAPPPTALTKFADIGPLEVWASCAAGPDLTVIVTTDGSSSNALIHATYVDDQTENNHEGYIEDDDLDPPPFGVIEGFDLTQANDDDLQGTFTYMTASGMSPITATYMLEEVGGTFPRCRVAGTIMRSVG